MARRIGEVPAQIRLELWRRRVFVETHKRTYPFVVELGEIADVLAGDLRITEQRVDLRCLFLRHLQAERLAELLHDTFETIDGIADGYRDTFLILPHLLTPHILHDIVGEGCSDGIRWRRTPLQHVGQLSVGEIRLCFTLCYGTYGCHHQDSHHHVLLHKSFCFDKTRQESTFVNYWAQSYELFFIISYLCKYFL